jgi:hypothetical protein
LLGTARGGFANSGPYGSSTVNSINAWTPPQVKCTNGDNVKRKDSEAREVIVEIDFAFVTSDPNLEVLVVD